ncbi:hypothetical protein AVEN_111955-1 [Araneus ventricosus]|uniref:Uncharacterized protein n=1 Tax=Araneus ventricosus TaxID=182803 RepID=A0A4Y2SHC7_ARAVE|nr:hypothetical protein AVEN_111955-1 [Araneus ventricosus]
MIPFVKIKKPQAETFKDEVLCGMNKARKLVLMHSSFEGMIISNIFSWISFYFLMASCTFEAAKETQWKDSNELNEIYRTKKLKCFVQKWLDRRRNGSNDTMPKTCKRSQ